MWDIFERRMALHANTEDVLSNLMKTAQPADVPSPEKLQAYSALMDRYNKAMAANSPARANETIAKLEQMRSDAERLIEHEPIDYLRSELVEYIIDVLGTAAEGFKVLDKIAQAREHYEHAIRKAELHRLTKHANRYRLKLTELLVGRTSDFDSALDDLLPVWQQMRDGWPSLERVQIMQLLSEAYINIGDHFEARLIMQLIEEDLSTLGYPAPDHSNLYETLERWIETADRTTTGPNAFRQALFGALVVYMSIDSMRSKTDVSPHERDSAFSRIESLNKMHNDLVAHEQAILERDQRNLESLAFQSTSKFTAPASEWPSFQQRSENLNKRVVALRARIDANDASDLLLAEAENLAEEARSLNAGRIIGAVRGMQGDLMLKLERPADAVRAWREAYTISVNAGQIGDALYMLSQIVGAYTPLKDYTAVSAVCGEAIDLIERDRYNVSPAYQQSAFLQQKLQFYILGVFSAYKLGDYDLMLRRMELTKARASLQQIAQRTSGADREKLESEIREVNAELDHSNDESTLALRQKRRTLWDLVAIQRAEANRQQPPSEFSLSEVQKALKPDEAVVYYYWLQPGVLLVVALDKEKIEVSREIIDNEYASLVELIEYLGQMKRPYQYLNNIHAFAHHLLPDSVQSILRGKKHVIFSPHRILHLFPFQALRWEEDYLVNRFAVSYAPNLTSLLVRYPPNGATSVLAVGVEHFAVPGRSLTPLPGALREINYLQALYTEHGIEIEILEETAASCQRLQEWADDGRLSSFRVLHFATHGEDILGDEPMETYLCLHDGLLDGLDITAWQLNAELVVLSACHSGKRSFKGRGLDELPGDEMFGLQAAFFNAGAHRVVGALWPVNDKAAASIMKTFHRQLAVGTQPELALQAAVTEYIQNASKDYLKHPYFWAPFFISSIGQRSDP